MNNFISFLKKHQKPLLIALLLVLVVGLICYALRDQSDEPADDTPAQSYPGDTSVIETDPISGAQMLIIDQEPESSESGRTALIGFDILSTVGFSSSQQSIILDRLPTDFMQKHPEIGSLHYLKDSYRHDEDVPTRSYLTAISDTGATFSFVFDTKYSISTMSVQITDASNALVLSY